MANKPIVLFAFSRSSSSKARRAELLKEKAKIESTWRSQPLVEWHIVEVDQEEDLADKIAPYKERIILFHLSGESSLFQHGVQEQHWRKALGSASNLKFAFLSGCADTIQVNDLLTHGVKAVIGSQYSETPNEVYRFAELFYFTLVGQSSLLNAFEKAANVIAEKFEWSYIPSAIFTTDPHQSQNAFKWGLYTLPGNQTVLNWKLIAVSPPPIDPPKKQPAPAPAFDPKTILPPRKKKSIFGGLKLLFIEKFFKSLSKKSTNTPVYPELVLPDVSPRIPGDSPDPDVPRGGLEFLTDQEEDFGTKIEQAKQAASPDLWPQFEALAQQWAALSAALEQKTLVKEAVKKRPPFIDLTPGRIEALIEKALTEELFDLHAQLLELELTALAQPLSRGLLLRKTLSKSEVGKYHALIIGINTYEDQDINSLTGALEDAKALHKLLSEKYFFDHLQLLENPDRDAIIDAFDDLDFKAAEGDNILIFYAGHGKWDKDSGIGYWLPSNANDDRRRNWIENSTIHNAIKRLNNCQHILLISDSCFSGALLDTREVAGPTIKQDDKDIQILYQAKSRQILTSGAKEPVPDDSSFFRSLLKTLETSTDETFSAYTLYHEIRTQVLNDLRVGQNPQVGKILNAGDDGGDFVFFRR
jgi:hypothetical protein